MAVYRDASDPHNYHKVVDCQYACPAHTNVPEYLRLIAQGKYTESYLLNRESNVFPGILGRTCDRPCEPACRRGRVDGKPVAICRLKRVAADNRDDVSEFLPKAPAQKNGKRVALIGAGPASLTVANDLMPLGYDVVIFEKIAKRVLIIGVGNTAMDCCRTSRRLGGTDVKVIARRGRKYFKASPWELEDAEEEGVHIVENHAPKRFVVENGKLVGMEMDVLRWTE